MLGLILFKFWLVAAQPVFAIGPAGHDDQLFINLAGSILDGHWLGPYSQFTLMKGPMYSIFLAGIFLLNIPLPAALQLLYVGGCLVVVNALRPLIRSTWLRLSLFTVLLFNPVTYESVVNARVIRQNLLPALVLLLIGSVIGLYTRRTGPKSKLLGWALLGGVTLPVFWLTREEGIWILPCLGILWLAVAVAVFRARLADWHGRLALVAMPAVLWGLGVGIVASLNLHYYGVFTTCEFKQADFKAAFGALLRVEPVQWRPYLPITRETRERLYPLSPAFAELRPYLEGSIGESWARASETLTHIPPQDHEIAVGWFMWALRDAVAAAGHCKSGKDAMAYYARLAREINEACERGLIQAGPRRTGFTPAFRREMVSLFTQAVNEECWFFFSFKEMHTATQQSIGPKEQVLRFADLTRARLAPMADEYIPPRQHRLDRIRLPILNQLSRFYHRIMPWAGGLAAMAFVAAMILNARRKRFSFFTLLSLGCLSSVVVLLFAIALIQATSFPAINTGYFSGCYGLWLLFVFVSLIDFAMALRADQSQEKDGTAATHPSVAQGSP